MNLQNVDPAVHTSSKRNVFSVNYIWCKRAPMNVTGGTWELGRYASRAKVKDFWWRRPKYDQLTVYRLTFNKIQNYKALYDNRSFRNAVRSSSDDHRPNGTDDRRRDHLGTMLDDDRALRRGHVHHAVHGALVSVEIALQREVLAAVVAAVHDDRLEVGRGGDLACDVALLVHDGVALQLRRVPALSAEVDYLAVRVRRSPHVLGHPRQLVQVLKE